MVNAGSIGVSDIDNNKNNKYVKPDYSQYNASTTTNENNTFLLKPSLLNQAQSLFYIESVDDFTEALESEPEIKEWIIQRYIKQPHLIDECKYHIRSYILCVGNLSVYLWKPMLALVAPMKYNKEEFNRTSHITNTCAHTGDHNNNDDNDNNNDSDHENNNNGVVFDENHSVRLLSQCFPNNSFLYNKILSQIQSIISQLFESLHSEPTVYQPLNQAFEIYGLDFLVDYKENVWFLEANAGPDFAMTGNELKIIIEQLMEHTAKLTIDPLIELIINNNNNNNDSKKMTDWNAANLAEETIKNGNIQLATINDNVDNENENNSVVDGEFGFIPCYSRLISHSTTMKMY